MSKAAYTRARSWSGDLIDIITSRRFASTSYRFLALQIALKFADSESTPCIVFSAADPAEMSSDTLSMVALFLHEELGSNVLLVDGSFTNSGVSDLFGFTEEVGLTECLNDVEININDCIKPTANPGVFVFPAGQVSSQIRRPAESQAVRVLMHELDQFDFILIQQGSITLDTRYLIFAQLADLVLLCCEEGATLVSEFEACQEIFREYEVGNVGVILLEAGE